MRGERLLRVQRSWRKYKGTTSILCVNVLIFVMFLCGLQDVSASARGDHNKYKVTRRQGGRFKTQCAKCSDTKLHKTVQGIQHTHAQHYKHILVEGINVKCNEKALLGITTSC